MKKGIKFLIILNILCYINSYYLSYQTSLQGMKNVNQIWLVSPYLFMFISLFVFSYYYKTIRVYAAFDFGIRFLAIIVLYKGSNYELSSTPFMISITIGIVFFISNLVLEYIMYQKIKQYCIEHNIKEITLRDVAVLSQNTETYNKIKTTGNRVYKHLFSWWNLIFALAMFSVATVFIQANQPFFIITAIIIYLFEPYMIYKSIQAHLTIFEYVNYEDEYKKKRKIINLTGILIGYIYVFCISFFGSKDISYANGLAIIFFLPLYKTEKNAMIKNKKEIDKLLNNSEDDV